MKIKLLYTDLIMILAFLLHQGVVFITNVIVAQKGLECEKNEVMAFLLTKPHLEFIFVAVVWIGIIYFYIRERINYMEGKSTKLDLITIPLIVGIIFLFNFINDFGYYVGLFLI